MCTNYTCTKPEIKVSKTLRLQARRGGSHSPERSTGPSWEGKQHESPTMKPLQVLHQWHLLGVFNFMSIKIPECFAPTYIEISFPMLPLNIHNLLALSSQHTQKTAQPSPLIPKCFHHSKRKHPGHPRLLTTIHPLGISQLACSGRFVRTELCNDTQFP